MAWVRKHVAAGGTETFRGYYRDPDGRTRSAGTFPSTRAALRAANREEGKVGDGTWLDAKFGKITFRDFVENVWFPSRHLEATTYVSYRSNLDKHFLPAFGDRPMAKISPSMIQEWVTKVIADGLSPAQHHEVSRDAALDLQAGSTRPDHRVQPLRRDRATEGGPPADPNDHSG